MFSVHIRIRLEINKRNTCGKPQIFSKKKHPKNVAFLVPNNERSEKEMKKNSSTYNSIKKNKLLRD